MAKRRSSYYDDDYWPRYEPTRPIRVEDGIKAKSQRGDFTQTWWADRWIKALARLMDSGRLQRGRSYARQGQVMDIEIRPGTVAARVQGSRPKPYRLTIELSPLTDVQWDAVLDALAGQAIYAAQLLNGEMPSDVEQVFDAVHVPLFPGSRGDLVTACSCPDAANPCKHIAAVYYLLGERFDADPFLLFQLRGRSKDQIAAALRERRAGRAPAAPGADSEGTPSAEDARPALDAGPDRYWALGNAVDELSIEIGRPDVELALLKRLGLPELAGVGTAFRQELARTYSAVTERALELAFADSKE
jgi:uncharacterized Zn finger protein